MRAQLLRLPCGFFRTPSLRDSVNIHEITSFVPFADDRLSINATWLMSFVGSHRGSANDDRRRCLDVGNPRSSTAATGGCRGHHIFTILFSLGGFAG